MCHLLKYVASLVMQLSAAVHKSNVQFDVSYAYDGPRLWNNLPTNIGTVLNITSFQESTQVTPF